MKRGEVWWASLGEPEGSEPGFRRPVVIVSSNEFNLSRINTVTVVTVTSNLRLAEAPGNFKLAQKTSGLNRDSVVNVSQVITLDKTSLTAFIGKLDGRQVNLLNNGLKLALNL